MIGGRLLRLLGARRLADVLLLALAVWFVMLLVWTQTSPLQTVQRIGTMKTFQFLYGALAINVLACFFVELPRTLRRAARRAMPSRFAPPGFTAVKCPWRGIEEASRSLARRGYHVQVGGTDRLIAQRGRLAPVWGMVFHVLWPLLIPAAVWSLATRETLSVAVGLGETMPVTRGAAGPSVELTVQDIDVKYFEDQVFFTELRALVSVDGDEGRWSRINEPISVHGGDLRVASMGYMPALEIRNPEGKVLERAYVKAGLFPPGVEAEVGLPPLPHRIYLRFYPDAVPRPGGAEPDNRSMNLVRPMLGLRAVRGKIPVGGTFLALGEKYRVEGFDIEFGAGELFVVLDWVFDPGGKLALALSALAIFFLGLKVLWPRTEWAVWTTGGEIVAARRVEVFEAFAADDGVSGA